MVKLKYVGLKESEDAFSGKTKIVWRQGMQAEVSEEHAKLMLNHPDVFALADEVVAAEKTVDEVIAPQAATAKPKKEAKPKKDLAE